MADGSRRRITERLSYGWLGLVVALAVIVYVNRRFFALLWRVGGWSLATAGIAFQWMFYIYGTVGFLVGTLTAARRD